MSTLATCGCERAAWLIEAGWDDGQGLLYLCIGDSGLYHPHGSGPRVLWCRDPDLALRFSREADAEAFRGALFNLTGSAPSTRAVEHLWRAGDSGAAA